VTPIHLFDIAAQQARWLSLRQATVATNIANVNTPGFTARDVRPFQDILDRTQLTMVATNPMHISGGPPDLRATTTKSSDPWETTQSGNTVSLEQEMMKAGEVSRTYSLNTNIVKAFNNMLLASVKS
jgi:flagellar basal-body rod protein FlgB